MYLIVLLILILLRKRLFLNMLTNLFSGIIEEESPSESDIYIIAPSSTGIIAPVIYDAISLARKRAALAISSASPILVYTSFSSC